MLTLNTNSLDHLYRIEDLRLIYSRIPWALKQMLFQATLLIVDGFYIQETSSD